MTDSVPILGQGPQVTPNDVLEMKFSLIRIEEQLKSGAKEAEHRHVNIKQSMDAFVPRRELDQIFAGITARLASVDGDLKDKADKSEVAMRLSAIDGDLKEKAGATEVAELHRRIGGIEGNQTWVIRTVFGLVIGAIMAAVLVLKHG